MITDSFNIASTVINDFVRVSSAGIVYEESFGGYVQYETWIFSEDKQMQSDRQVIHGTPSEPMECYEELAKKVHGYVVEGLKKKFNFIS